MLTRADERVCLEARRHGIVLVRPLTLALVLAAAAGVAVVAGWPFTVAGAVLAAAGAFVALRAVWRWERTHVVVTTDKLYVVYGTLRRRAAAVRLARVGTLEIEQTLLGRLLGYGTIVAGELEIDYVPEPRRVYGLVARLAQ
jgi:uncharacterized membrane protein YdbT with pleckstrin-like domain